MASQTIKIRVVRCPKCLKRLPELENLPIYKCGGCGTTLKVKRRKEDQEGEISAQKNELRHDSEDKNSTCSSQEATTCSSDGCIQVEDKDCAKEEPATRKIANGNTSSCELSQNEKQSSSSVTGDIQPNGNHERDSDMERASPENRRQISGGGNFTSVSQKSVAEAVPSKGKASPLSGELDESEKIVRRYADLIGSRGVVKPATVTDGIIASEDDGGGVSRPQATAEATEGRIISEDDIDGVSKCQATDGNIISEDDMVEVLKPPAVKSNHAYDASVSSNDGWGDQVSDHQSYQSKRSLFGSERVMELASTTEGPAKEDISVNNGVAIKPELQNHQDRDRRSLESKRSRLGSETVLQEVNTTRECIKEDTAENNKIASRSRLQNELRKLSLMSMIEKQDPVTIRSVSLDQDKLPENTRYRIRGQKQVGSHDTTSINPQSWLGPKTEQLLPRRDFSPRYGKNAPSKYRHDVLRLSFYPPRNLESVEHNQMELLRKVDELSDQINRSYARSWKAYERFPSRENQQERQRPLHYNHDLADQGVAQQYDVKFPRPSPGAYRASKSMPFQCDYSQMHLPGNVKNCRHHSNCPCFKEDLQCLQQLPPSSLCCSGGQCMEYPGRCLYIRYPLQNCDVGALPSEEIGRDHNADNLYRRERRKPVNRFCRPIAGGAPFVVCYSCQKLLHLPADSVLSSKRCHRLQCGSCSKVLTFSFHRRNHVAPPNPAAVTPTGGVHDNGASTSKQNSASTSCVNDDALVDPYSYSEDYGLSISTSVSKEGDVASVRTELSVRQSTSVDRKHPLSRRTKPMGEMKNGTATTGYENKLKHPVQAFDSDSSSSDEATLDGEEIQKAKGSPLHRLLGYSSPLKLLYQWDE